MLKKSIGAPSNKLNLWLVHPSLVLLFHSEPVYWAPAMNLSHNMAQFRLYLFKTLSGSRCNLASFFSNQQLLFFSGDVLMLQFPVTITFIALVRTNGLARTKPAREKIRSTRKTSKEDRLVDVFVEIRAKPVTRKLKWKSVVLVLNVKLNYFCGRWKSWKKNQNRREKWKKQEDLI